MKNIKLDIIKCLIDEGEPLILNHIAKRTENSPQSIEYHIKQLIDDGVLHCAANTDNRKYYFLSVPFYEPALIDALYGALTPTTTNITKLLPQDTPYNTIVTILSYMLELFISDATK